MADFGWQWSSRADSLTKIWPEQDLRIDAIDRGQPGADCPYEYAEDGCASVSPAAKISNIKLIWQITGGKFNCFAIQC